MTVTFKPRLVTRRIILHDSHTTPDVIRAERVLRWGGMRMGLVDIGYHYVIERDGNIIEARPRDRMGSHTPGANHDSIGICLVGGRSSWGAGAEPHTYPDDNFTQDQREACYDLIRMLKQEYPGVAVLGHSEVQKFRDKDEPGCPPFDMEDFRADYLTYIQTGVV